MSSMFDTSKFNKDISMWNVDKVTDWDYMFSDSPLNLPKNSHKKPKRFNWHNSEKFADAF